MNVYDLADMARLVWSRTWRWLVWSPRRLGAVAAAVMVIVVGCAQLSGTAPGLPSDDAHTAYASDDLPAGWEDWQVATASPETVAAALPDPATQAPTTTSTLEGSPDEPQDSDPAHRPPSKKTQQRAKTVAYLFAKAYVHPGRSRKAWYARVARFAVEPLRKPLRTVNPQSIQANKITGKTRIDSLGDMGGRITVPTDAGTLMLAVTNMGSRWAVSKVTPPVRTSAPR